MVKHRACFTKSFTNSKKVDSVIHPDGLLLLAHPMGTSVMKCVLKCTRRNTKNGGIIFPEALTATARVTSDPLSAERKLMYLSA